MFFLNMAGGLPPADDFADRPYASAADAAVGISVKPSLFCVSLAFSPALLYTSISIEEGPLLK